MYVKTAYTNVIFGWTLCIVVFTCCACAYERQNFRCYTASKPCVTGVKMVRQKECFKYRGRCMERIYPANVTKCCNGFVGKHCDNQIQDDFYFSSCVGSDDNYLRQRPQRQITGRPRQKGEKGDRGDKGDRGPEGFIGMPGRKGEPGRWMQKGQKGEPGISVKGEQGKQGQNGKAGRRGHKGDAGPTGPPGLPGLPGTNGTINTGECNCSDLATRVKVLENLVRGIMNGSLAIPREGRPPGGIMNGSLAIPREGRPPGALENETVGDKIQRQPAAIPTDNHPSRDSQEIPINNHSPLESQGSPIDSRPPRRGSQEFATIRTYPQSQANHRTHMPDNRRVPSISMSTRENTDAAFSTFHSTTPIDEVTPSTETPLKCNKTTISDCPSKKFCNTPKPFFIKIPPPFPNNTRFTRTYFDRLSCCSSETLDFAFMYYKQQDMLI
ncbi:uncharacterized protein [Argopecten irradians]|uniref:uncharacterized protein n=1 Tax=Argopecten irradians TaxID=31199 RepID=UPI003718DE80